ncbi:MAG: ABC transporter permease subunit, partial [Actinobacteria bacterium]|nr:ABC transporter permease subunit [Actinomycetota bacterium]
SSRGATKEISADQKGLGEPLGLRLDRVFQTEAPAAAIFTKRNNLLSKVRNIDHNLTKPGIGELGRVLAVLVLAIAAFTWIAAFFGWFGMLQKVRLSFLLLGLAALLAPNFIGEARQRLTLVYGWVGMITVFHVMVTIINTPSSIEVPTEDFAGGFMVSIYVTVFTLLFSFPLGVLLALARTSRLPIFRLLATIYIESFRGVPLITMLFFFTVFVNLFLPEGMELAVLAAVTIAFVLFSAAYLAENVRGGLQAVRRGQYEASDALGLTTVQRTGFIASACSTSSGWRATSSRTSRNSSVSASRRSCSSVSSTSSAPTPCPSTPSASRRISASVKGRNHEHQRRNRCRH